MRETLKAKKGITTLGFGMAVALIRCIEGRKNRRRNRRFPLYFFLAK